MVKDTAIGTLAGALSGRVTLSGTVLRLPAPSGTGLLENDTIMPGSEVMFSSRSIS